MKEIVQKIIQTEREVRERVEKARGEAQRIVREAEKSGRELIEERRQKAAEEAQGTIERMRREAEAERTRRIEKVKGGSSALLEAKGAQIDRAAERVAAVILGAEEE